MTATAEPTAPLGTLPLGTLPNWDLSDLYSGPDSPRLRTDLERVEREAQAFHGRYSGKLPGLSGKELGQAVVTYEALDETLTRIMSYAGLLYAGDQSDGAIARFYQSMQERVTAVSVHLLFFTLELNQLSDKDIDAKLKAPELHRYAAWLRDVRIFRPHQLSDELERFLHEKAVVGRNAWTRLFDETMASLRFRIDGQDLTSAEALNLLSAPDAATRKAAAIEIGAVLGRNIKLFALITNTLAKDKEIEDKWRRYDQPWSSRNLSNRVEDAVVEALVGAVKDSYPALSHRYYTLKAKWFGGDTLDYWDRNAPLPDVAERTIPWEEAREIVLSSYARFSPDLAGVGRRFFENAWIDAPVRPGKNPGAFAHPTVPSAHPYLLVNYMGKTRDVMTLAHELGHGVHQVLAGGQGHLQSDTPLTLAETASVFGEMLTFRGLLAAETDPARRRALLAGKVEDMLNTVVRQTAFYDFERRVHSERRQGELSEERLGEIWQAVQTESLGPALRFDAGYATYWSYIPHFVHSPFYVYAYAFGDCLVNSLYAAFEEASAHNGSEAFARRYLEMLAAGGTKRHKELLAPFGLDATDPAFWHKGLGMLKGFIDELEALG
ncbi:M3 family oligoendopeptidase [Nitrospirillum viridazoti]|uniref:Oligoendopeptidase F n=1 Tax=Nitrospirillum viridazoti CBAmc TaxID=1441467 RepID=A0A248JMW6_9PROT|nr:M3 family oligoendopeptidase [Nitrospirillum amazonense]ASG20062.1 oligoendopeptidase F [Nitrospirillum amazonense CBAmc]TWB36241.1 oligoendopeptidase F [Nitrospirillum amazonense]